MGIQGLLQALKPYVEPVHVSKYSGQRVGIDAYSWLHKGAYGCSWQQLREVDTKQGGEKLPPYVMYCMHRIRMLLYNKITPVVVFDGGRLPLKALTEQNRRRGRDDNLQKAERKLAEGDLLSAQDHFQKAIEITPAMAHELIKVLREERIEYVVAPYEADAQLAHLSTLAPEVGGISTIITEDSDLLAYGCKVVLFKMDKFGSGEELCMDKILQTCPPPATGLSFRNFNHDLFLAMCVLAGCDFLASIPGIGVKKAHALLAKYRNIHRVLNKLKISKHAEVPEDYITNFWQAKAIFKHARVYEKKSKSLVLLNPLPDDLLKEFGGDTDFLGPDLPQSRARAIAIGQLDPTTMCSFDVLLPNRTATTPFSIPKNPELEFMQAQKEKMFKIPKLEPQQPIGISVFEESKVVCGSGSQSLQTAPVLMPEVRMEPSISESFMSGSPPGVDENSLADLRLTESSGHLQQRVEEDAAPSQKSEEDIFQCNMPLDIPNNNPFRSQQGEGQNLVQHPDISSAGKFEFSELSSGNPVSNIFSSVEDSQQLSSPSEDLTSEFTSLHCKIESPVCAEPEVACCTIMDQTQVEGSVPKLISLDSSNCVASQRSSNFDDVSVLTDISPNVVAFSPANEYPIASTPSSAPSIETKDLPLQRRGKMIPAGRSISRLKKSASHVERRNLGGKRSRESFSRTPSKTEGSILRFFKPIVTPKKLAPEF
ncbi:unnamed protein product [Calypogeia fissa]